MSLQAMTWVLFESDIYEHGDFRLMIALADRAHDDGTAAYPSVGWLAKRINRSERSVQRGLQRLKDQGLIRYGDQRLVEHFKADRRPIVYDLAMSKRGDSSDTSRGDSSDVNGVTSDVTQTVHSLLRNETVGEKIPDADASALDIDVKPEPKRRRRMTTLPEGWQPSERHYELAQGYGFGRARVGHESEQFQDRALAKGEAYQDWDAAFRTWLRNASKFDQRGGRQPVRESGRDAKTGVRVERSY